MGRIAINERLVFGIDSQNANNEKFIRMTTAPVERLICGLAVPTTISMLISSIYNMADTYFVGSLGTSATAGVGVVFSLMTVIQAMGFFFGHGSGNFISRSLGAKDYTEASKMASVGFFSALIAGAVIAALGLLFIDPLARFLGATETILPYARDYLRYILLGAPFMAGSLVLNNQLRFQGSAVYGMVGMISGAVLNIALDPLFIFTFSMGVSGAALATMISQCVGCVILYIGCSRGGNIRVSAQSFKPTFSSYAEIARGGAPSLFRQGLGSVASIALNNVAGIYGDAAIAAISVCNRVTMFASSALIGFGQGFQPVCGFNYGAKLYGRVKKAFWFCVKASFLALLAIAAALFVFAPQIIAIFRRDDQIVIEIGTLMLRAGSITFPLSGFVVMSNMMLQTIGKSVKASVLAMSRQGLFLLPSLYILSFFFGLLGVQICQAVADAAAFALCVPMVLGVLREMDRLIETEERGNMEGDAG